MNIDLPTLNPAAETDRLEDLLSRRLGNRIRDLRVVLQQAGLVLRGWTETYYAKQVAQHAAMELSGMPILANEIEVM
jgi:osmotically-inducible protein OsmY